MLKLHSVLLPLILLSIVAGAQTDDRKADRDYIRQSEADWAETVANGNCKVLERILADDFKGVDVDGSRYTKADDLNGCRTKPSKFESNHLKDVDITFFGDMAIARGNEAWKLKSGKSGQFFWTDTWLKRNGKWQIVAAEDLMPVPSPFAN